MSLFELLFPENENPQVWVLVDPDTNPWQKQLDNICAAEAEGVSAVLIGGSFLVHDDFDQVVLDLKNVTSLPVILFPGSSRQVSRHDDGILFTSLLSGRNPQYLIGEQVMAAPQIIKMNLS